MELLIICNVLATQELGLFLSSSEFAGFSERLHSSRFLFPCVLLELSYPSE